MAPTGFSFLSGYNDSGLDQNTYRLHDHDVDTSFVSLSSDSSQARSDAEGSTTNGSSFTAYGPELTPLYAQAIIIVLYSSVTVLAVGGNFIVCYIVLAYQRMRTVTNFFIFNLACSDILMSVLCIPFTFVANALMLYWPFPDVMCPFVTYVQTLAVFLSAFTLVGISLDRYRAIMFPLRPRMTKQQAVVIIIVIWLLSLAVPLPIAILSKTAPIDNTTDRSLCLEVWPDPHQR